MSRKPTAPPTAGSDRAAKTQPLRDLFRQEQESSGGNPAAAFIAVLDELDRRNVASADRIEANAGAFRKMADWHNQATELLTALPRTVEAATDTTIRQMQGVLERRVEDKARLGAQEGSDGAREAVRALREAKSDYEHRKGFLRLLASTALPMAFVIALLLGFLFPGLLIRALPASWSWTCAIISAQHVHGSKDQPASCVIRKD